MLATSSPPPQDVSVETSSSSSNLLDLTSAPSPTGPQAQGIVSSSMDQPFKLKRFFFFFPSIPVGNPMAKKIGKVLEIKLDGPQVRSPLLVFITTTPFSS